MRGGRWAGSLSLLATTLLLATLGRQCSAQMET
jgi:hypothetical protein